MSRLIPADRDLATLAHKLEERWLRVSQDYARRKGLAPRPPESIVQAMLEWRTMLTRFRTGDMRYTVKEKMCTREVCQFVADLHSELNGHKPRVIEWKD